MAYLKKYGKRGAFTFHFILAVTAMLVLNVVDIMMFRQGGIVSHGAERTQIPATGIALLPYHFWVMGVMWLMLNFIIGATYFFYTRDLLGAGVLSLVGIIYSMLAVQDILFFYYQGQPSPEQWTWLYWQNDVLGTPLPGVTVGIMALVGGVAIILMYLLRVRSLKK